MEQRSPNNPSNLRVDVGDASHVQKTAVESQSYEVMLEWFKLIVASAVVLFLISIVFTGIGNGWMVMRVHPAIGFLILFCILVLMAYVEALHYSCVNLEKVDPAAFEKEYPRAAENQRLVNNATLVKRFLLGRQGFVIAIVFTATQLTAFPYMPTDLWGMPKGLIDVLFKTGLPGVALVLTVGQLISQLFVESYTLAFHNLPGVWFVIKLCLATEYIGLCHWSWLLYEISNRLACIKIVRAKKLMESTAFDADGQEGDPLSPTIRNRGPDFDLGVKDNSNLSAFDIFRYIWSTALSLSAICVVLYGISTGGYILHVPVWAAYIIAGTVLTLLFYLEGLMIAVAATTDWDRKTWEHAYPRAYKVHEMVNQPNKVKAFIIGRQFMTLLTGFVLAEVFTFSFLENDGGMPDWLFYLIFRSGFPGVLLVLSIGQLVPELLAAEYPLRFLNLRGVWLVSRACLFFDSLAVGHAGWAIYYMSRGIVCRGESAKSEGSENDRFKDMKLESAELYHKTGSPYGGPRRSKVPNQVV